MAIGLVLGGGAPNLTLMSGALLALDEAGIDFRVVNTTGAGMVVGLLWAAPRQDAETRWQDARRTALRHTRDMGIDDAIYEHVPVNYRIFQKSGAAAMAWSNAVDPVIDAIPRDNRRRRLLADTMALWSATMQPTDLGPSSRGLCQPPPWIERIVDFDRLKQNLGDRDFHISAYCIETEQDVGFGKDVISADHFKAALAMPFIYAPYELDGRTYLEGSAFSPLDLDTEFPLKLGHGGKIRGGAIDTVIFMDLMGHRELIGQPRWLIDAWGKSIVAPLTRLAEQDLKIFKLRRDLQKLAKELEQVRDTLGQTLPGDFAEREQQIVATLNELRNLAADENHHASHHDPQEQHSRAELLRMPFRHTINARDDRQHVWEHALDWSHSNMSRLFDIGYETGEKFVEQYRTKLDASMEHQPEAADA